MAAAAFRTSGYEAYSMRGGLARWVDEGREISPQDGYVANH
jgi:rhodanese-related sulfurtransferase